MDEIFNVFDKFYTKTGIASRSEVHEQGLWHETFHCWMYYREGSEINLYFQQRSKLKKDYPDLLDTTVAGHILHTETPLDGVREIKEELGIDVEISQLHYAGFVPMSITLPSMIDKEFTNVYLLERKFSMHDFNLQLEEVQGIFVISLSDLEQLLADETYITEVNGFIMQGNEKEKCVKLVQRKNLCAFYPEYYTFLINYLKSL